MFPTIPQLPGGDHMTRTTDPPQRRQSLPQRYRSLSNFYAADSRRVRSRELDIGLWWREQAGGPLHRAAWVSDTGELYIVRLGPSDDGGGQVEVLAIVAEHEELERVLEGWREQCGGPRSLAWLRERASRVGERVRARRLKALAGVTAVAAMVSAATALSLDLA